MKVAVCISGQPRNYKKGFLELKKWFLDKYDCDVYIHTWYDTKAIFETGHDYLEKKTYSFTHKDYSNILKLYKPKAYEFQKPIVFDETSIVGTHCKYKLNNILSAAYSIHSCYNLVKESGIEYDYIIRYRFDLRFTDYVSSECVFLKDITQLDPNKYNTFKYPDFEGRPTRTSEIDDQFIVSGPSVADIYSDYFCYILNYVYMDGEFGEWLKTVTRTADKIVAESLLKYHVVVKNNIEVNFVESLTEHFHALIMR
jgi:hypothetical protein